MQEMETQLKRCTSELIESAKLMLSGLNDFNPTHEVTTLKEQLQSDIDTYSLNPLSNKLIGIADSLAMTTFKLCISIMEADFKDTADNYIESLVSDTRESLTFLSYVLKKHPESKYNNTNPFNKIPTRHPQSNHVESLRDEFNSVLESNKSAMDDFFLLTKKSIEEISIKNERALNSAIEFRNQSIEEFKEKINQIDQLLSKSNKELENKTTEIDQLLSHSSEKVLTNDFALSALTEKTNSDRLRYGALTCMAIIVVLLSIVSWQTLTTNLAWEKSIFFIVVSFLFSVPAAYMARESTKHRQQQYNYHQTSLDLAALPPFIATLKEEDQQKIKIDIANRIFATKDFSGVNKESYPINIHEILLAAVQKLDKKTESSKSTLGGK